MLSTLPLEPATIATIASPIEQLRQRLSIARVAAASLSAPKTERERKALRMLLKAIDDAAAMLPQLD